MGKKVTLTSWAAVIDTVHVAVVTKPQAAPHCGNSPRGEVAVRTTLLPLGNMAVHADGQSMPGGVLPTVPTVPGTESVRLTRSANAGVKVTVTVCAAVIDTVQVGPVVDWHTPPQPEKTLPWAGAAVRTTLLPLGKSALQAEPHEMPGGALVTVPEPVTPTRSPNRSVKVALTSCASVIETVQVGPVVDWHAPPQPEKTLPCDGLAVSTTLLPLGNVAAHADGQSTPVGTLATLPEPVTLTWSPNTGMNVALTLCAPVIETVQLDPFVDAHAPPQAERTLPCDGVAVSTTLLPPVNAAAHADGQSTPAGALATLPAPATLTWSAYTGVNVAVTLCAAVMDTVQVGSALD